MSLTGLFAAAAQKDAFLSMVCLGASLAALQTLLTPLRRRLPRFALVGDVLLAVAGGAGALWVMVSGGQGTLRLYALLGAGVGVLLWLMGPDALIRGLLRRADSRKAKKPPADKKSGAA